MVTANNEMRAAEILADDAVPQRLLRSSPAHGKIQQAQGGALLGVFMENVLVAPHPGEMVHVAGFGHAHHRMAQEVRLGLARRADGQLLMGAVPGIRSEEHTSELQSLMR